MSWRTNPLRKYASLTMAISALVVMYAGGNMDFAVGLSCASGALL